MRDRSGIPDDAPVDQMIVNKPANRARTPFYREPVVLLRCVKSEGDIACRAPVSVVKLRARATGVIKDIDQETVWPIPCNFDIDLLPRRVTMEKKAGDHSRHARRLDGRLESPE